MKDTIKVYGTPTFTLLDGKGMVKSKFTLPNMIVSGGKEFIASRMQGNTSSVMSHIAIGTGVTATALINTALETETSRVAMSVAGGTVTSNIITFTATFGPGVGTGSFSEAGVFNANSGGTMLSRVVYPTKTKAAPDTLIVEWEIEIA